MFDEIADGVWCHEARYRFGALLIPHRVAVVRKREGGLIVHSPAACDDATRASLRALGFVVAIVWPSWWHDLFLRDWARAYPDARLFVAPDLRRAVRGFANARILAPDEPLDPDIDVAAVDGLDAWLDEVVMLHRPSKTLLVADLVVNVARDLPFPTSVFFALLGGDDGPKVPWFYRMVARDKRRLRMQLDRIAALDFDRLIMGHGAIVETAARASFVAAVDRLLPSPHSR